MLFAIVTPAQAQQNDTSENEVYLSFQYQGIVSVYITTYYKDDQFYLPVSELFNQLGIQHQVNQGSLSISGSYLGEDEFVLDFKRQFARKGETELNFEAEDFLIKEIDYFIRPQLFEQLFGLTFTTDFNNLTLDLETDDTLPVVAQYEREQKRQQIDRQQPLYDQEYYPLQYDRDYGVLDGAFLDYNLSGIYNRNSQLFTFSNAVGAEVLGGDVQGNIFGALSNQQSTITTTGLRWRYVQRNNKYFSNGIIGQTSTEGIANRSMTGFKISNKPVEPRQLFDRYVIDGNVTPQSEVELYLNNRLVDFQEADQSGNYRFVVPLTYGSTNYSVRIFRPSGQSLERNARIQIPFDYLPTGEVDYSLSGGELSNPILGSTERGYIGAASVSAGITEWLTARASSEYLTEYHDNIPSFTGTLNARLFSNYLISANVNSENFYRLTSSVVYSSGASWSLSYDYNPGSRRLYNIGGSDQQARINIFTPFQIGQVPLNIRLSSTYQQNADADLLRYRADLNSRLGRLNIRLGYQDQQIGDLALTTTSASRITNSYTYSLGRFNVPNLLRGMFLRGQLSYLPGLDRFEEMEFQLSKDVLSTGRIQLTYGHNFIGDFNTLSLNLTVDFNKVRSNTTSRITNSNLSVTQNIRGSVGYDPKANHLMLNNRQQVGQSGAAVRLFIDHNNDGAFQDSTDETVSEPAVRLNRSGGQVNVHKGINYISQLLPYYRYDIEINKGALNNPLLVPDLENFSIVTDPNQYKTIEIPFYLSGVISGRVDRKRDTTRQGLSGVRLYLESRYDKENSRESYSEEMNTFSDGSFYTYEVPPGKYDLYIDPNQLEFLNAFSNPDTMKIEVEALSGGDFVENLNFTVISKADTAKQPITATKDTTSFEDVEQESETDQELYYKVQLASFYTREKAEEVAVQAAKDLGGSFSVIQNTANGMFAIRGVPLSNRKQAVETIMSYHNSSYKSSALVVMQNQQKSTVPKAAKFIQIGAFSSKERAERFAGNSSKELNKETAITYNKTQELYKVYINERFSSAQQRELLLSTIRNADSYSNAFINNTNNIQIGAFGNRQRAYSFAKQSEMLLGKQIAVSTDSSRNHYNVYIDEEYASTTERQSVLDQIRNNLSASTFPDAFVSTYDDSPSTADSQKGRAMHFTFQVQVEGVKEKAEKDFLASLIEQNTDIELNSPEKNVFVFDKITSWKQAVELQRKLSQSSSSAGYPVIILIEKSSPQNDS